MGQTDQAPKTPEVNDEEDNPAEKKKDFTPEIEEEKNPQRQKVKNTTFRKDRK